MSISDGPRVGRSFLDVSHVALAWRATTSSSSFVERVRLRQLRGVIAVERVGGETGRQFLHLALQRQMHAAIVAGLDIDARHAAEPRRRTDEAASGVRLPAAASACAPRLPPASDRRGDKKPRRRTAGSIDERKPSGS